MLVMSVRGPVYEPACVCVVCGPVCVRRAPLNQPLSQVSCFRALTCCCSTLDFHSRLRRASTMRPQTASQLPAIGCHNFCLDPCQDHYAHQSGHDCPSAMGEADIVFSREGMILTGPTCQSALSPAFGFKNSFCNPGGWLCCTVAAVLHCVALCLLCIAEHRSTWLGGRCLRAQD